LERISLFFFVILLFYLFIFVIDDPYHPIALIRRYVAIGLEALNASDYYAFIPL
jgi:hypothetical protein